MEGIYDCIRYSIGPPLLLILCPIATQLLTAVGGPKNDPWSYSLLGNFYSWATVSILVFWALASLWIPGPIYEGPITKDGFIPKYKANGFCFFVISILIYIGLLFLKPSIAVDITDNFQQILATCNIVAFILCIYLLIQGKQSAKKQDSETTLKVPILYEFYRGMEVHPRLLGVDVKQLTNCRFGLMAWQLLVITFFVAGWIKHSFSYGHMVCTLLQTIYLAKFYWWETGYFTTLDITLDRAGYYICWGCIVWVPAFYTYSSYYLIENRPIISDNTSFIILLLGVISIALNYRIDWEKEYFRKQYNNGLDCTLWGKQVTYVEVTYTSTSGTKQSTLLTSGFWGVTRHLNYVFEIGLSLAWCLPGYGRGYLPFLYLIFIIVLLVHRVFRDEEKCQSKYGSGWDMYCEKVKYRMIPYIF